LPTPELDLRPTPAPAQTHSPCTFAREIAQGRPSEARGPTSLARVSLGLRPRALMQSSASLRDLADGVRRMSLRGRRPRACAAARARFSPIRPSYSPTVPRSAWERMFELPPGPPPGPGRRSCLVGLLGKWAAGRQPPSATLLPLSAPSAAPPSASVGEATASSDGRFSVGMCAGVGARGHLRDRSGRTRACGHDGVRRAASGRRHGSSFARDGRISSAGGALARSHFERRTVIPVPVSVVLCGFRA
jgi:hypothetical protein